MWQRDRLTGRPWQGEGLVVIPEAEAIAFEAGVVRALYQRPTALLVRRGEEEVRLAVPDVTRQGQLALIAAAAIFGIVAWLVGRPGRTS